jgi:DNA modification methylase
MSSPGAIRVLTGDCRAILPTLPAASVHCVVTSPPYWGLRDYGVAGQIGLEASFTDYIEIMRAVFAQVRRVLRPDGTLWLNMGDCYAAAQNGRSARDTKIYGHDNRTFRDKPFSTIGNGLKPKDLCGIPWRVAFALQADGWYLRSDIIWSKPNPMPESITDRPTKAHEYVFLMSKSERYYYDQDAIRDKPTGRTDPIRSFGHNPNRNDSSDSGYALDASAGRNKRTVWEIATAPFPEAHFATFPPALIEPCILAGCPHKACAACGAPWVRMQERVGPDGRAIVVAASDRHARDETGKPLMGDNMMDYGVRGSFNVGDKGTAKRNDVGFSPSCPCNSDAVPGTVLDPFAGAGTTGLVADRLARDAILIELSPAYAAMAENRITDDAPLFARLVGHGDEVPEAVA